MSQGIVSVRSQWSRVRHVRVRLPPGRRMLHRVPSRRLRLALELRLRAAKTALQVEVAVKIVEPAVERRASGE